uniref:Uncharacterized protein n=1 Tax=Timema cristinae TaxID=61476 RepID=A0A7R9DLR6_TIMCR|nr:unnamed protein product [Timema cristinae]
MPSIKDSNLVGDFNDTINNETHSFHIRDVEMKSPWDGFLPIKEQIKDESDTSNSVEEIVKTEIKLYDSSFGIMNSNKDHSTPVDKSEDESDNSNSVEEIVKTEIKLYDSSFGIMNSNKDHSTPVDKSEVFSYNFNFIF